MSFCASIKVGKDYQACIKSSLKKRNREIFDRYNQGVSIKDLTEQFYLMEYSIRRIIREVKQIV